MVARILVVEDEPNNLELALRIVRHAATRRPSDDGSRSGLARSTAAAPPPDPSCRSRCLDILNSS